MACCIPAPTTPDDDEIRSQLGLETTPGAGAGSVAAPKEAAGEVEAGGAGAGEAAESSGAGS